MFKNLPVRQKLIWIIMVVVLSSMFLSGIIFVIHDRLDLKDYMIDELSVLAQVIANRSTAALTFDDVLLAQENLTALKEDPSILAGCIYEEDGSLFASFYRKNIIDEICPVKPHDEFFYVFGKDSLQLFHPVLLEEKQIGTVYIRTDLEHLKKETWEHIIGGIIVFFLVGIGTCVLSNKLQRVISMPIIELEKTAARVRKEQDYGIRAEVKGRGDEIGQLVESFNSMLSQIELRDSALKESETRYRILVDQAVDAFFLHDMDGKIVDLNEKAVQSLGYTREELLNMKISDVDIEVQSEKHKEKFWEQLALGESVTFNSVFRRKDGFTFPVEVRAGRLEMGGENYIQGMARDISERVRAEEEKEKLEAQLRQTQKMEAIGTLAGGIAHDFNNILTAILGYAEMAKDKIVSGSAERSYIDEVIKGGVRAKELVRQILSFSRKVDYAPIPVEIRLVVHDALKLLRATIPTNIEIREEIDPDAGIIMADPTQIHQVMMNLCANAFHAMQETGGVLDVTLKAVNLSPDDLADHPKSQPGPYVKLSVHDTGSGMDEEIQSKIFDPFFTSKGVGRGTGMGLSVVHGIMESSKGFIEVHSKVGRGTTFELYYPRIKGKAGSVPADEAPEEIPGGNERILYVDDDPVIVNLGKKILEILGYNVTAVNSSTEALEIFRSDSNNFDLVITDQTMPAMTGVELTKNLLAVRSDILIVLCTGYSEVVSEESAKAMGIQAFMMKPYVLKDIAHVVRKVLDDKA